MVVSVTLEAQKHRRDMAVLLIMSSCEEPPGCDLDILQSLNMAFQQARQKFSLEIINSWIRISQCLNDVNSLILAILCI